MKLGVFAQFLPQLTPEQAIELVAKLGFEGIMLPVRPQPREGHNTCLTPRQVLERAEALRGQAHSLGLALPSVGGYGGFTLERTLEQDLAGIDTMLAAAAALGARHVRVSTAGTMTRLSPPYPKMLDLAKRQYAEAVKLARKHGVRIVIETHNGQVGPSVMKARAIMEGLDPDFIGIAWDVSNQLIDGREPYKVAAAIAGEYLAELHAKNLRFEPTGDVEDGQQVWKPVLAPLREGITHWPMVISTLKTTGFDGWIFFEQVIPREGESIEEAMLDCRSWFQELIDRPA